MGGTFSVKVVTARAELEVRASAMWIAHPVPPSIR